MNQNDKVALAMEVIKLNTEKDLYESAKEVVMDQLNPPKTQPESSVDWLKAADQRQRAITLEIRLDSLEKKLYEQQDLIRHAHQVFKDQDRIYQQYHKPQNEKTRDTTENQSIAIGFAYVWLLVLTVVFIINM